MWCVEPEVQLNYKEKRKSCLALPTEESATDINNFLLCTVFGYSIQCLLSSHRLHEPLCCCCTAAPSSEQGQSNSVANNVIFCCTAAGQYTSTYRSCQDGSTAAEQFGALSVN